MKVEISKKEKTCTIFDLKDGETFAYPTDFQSEKDNIFMRTGSNGKLMYITAAIKINAICLNNGKSYCFDGNHQVLPCNAKVVVE